MMPLISVAESYFSMCDINMYVLQWWENLKIPKSLLLPYLRGWLSRVWCGVCVRVMYLLHYFERVTVCYVDIHWVQPN